MQLIRGNYDAYPLQQCMPGPPVTAPHLMQPNGIHFGSALLQPTYHEPTQQLMPNSNEPASVAASSLQQLQNELTMLQASGVELQRHRAVREHPPPPNSRPSAALHPVSQASSSLGAAQHPSLGHTTGASQGLQDDFSRPRDGGMEFQHQRAALPITAMSPHKQPISPPRTRPISPPRTRPKSIAQLVLLRPPKQGARAW